MLSALIWLPLVTLSATASKPPVDFLLQVQTTGYENVIIKGNKKPKEKILRQMKIRIRQNVPFHSTVIIGGRELILKGRLASEKKGGFAVQIDYSDIRLTNLTVPDGDGRWRRVKNISSVNTTLSLRLGKEISLGGVASVDGAKASKYDIRAKLLPIRPKQHVSQRLKPRRPRPIHTDVQAGPPGKADRRNVRLIRKTTPASVFP